MTAFAFAARPKRPVLALFAAAALLSLVAASACSSDDPVVGCDDTKCAPGNKCLPLDGEVKCRKTCTSNVDPAQSCPFNYTCQDLGAASPFCVANTFQVQKSDKGQWGASCNPKDGIVNPACDGDQGFYCYGTSPTDGASYCTVFDCKTDLDCAAGFWCATVNKSPNVETNERKIGETLKACIKRTYCSPCNVDLDCPPQNGVPQHCAGDANGEGFCAPECKADDNCNNEAECVEYQGNKICAPRSGLCVGDGSICSPCRSDADCPDGACVKGQYTTEKACTVKSKIPCTLEGNKQGTDLDCPAVTSPPKTTVACIGSTDPEKGFTSIPPGQCHGIYKLGEGFDVGCWTPDR